VLSDLSGLLYLSLSLGYGAMGTHYLLNTAMSHLCSPVPLWSLESRIQLQKKQCLSIPWEVPTLIKQIKGWVCIYGGRLASGPYHDSEVPLLCHFLFSLVRGSF
jgi:hypothetical protein